MAKGRIILSSAQFDLTIERLCHQLIEKYDDFSQCCIVGVQEKGVLLADKIVKTLPELHKIPKLEYGKLDITFYRDDFRRRSNPIKASKNEMDFIIEGKSVILVDDVLYSGRTTQAALMALQDFGRPDKVEFLCLIDRQFNRVLPIQADYVGMQVDSIDEAYVRVRWAEIDGNNEVRLFESKDKLDS